MVRPSDDAILNEGAESSRSFIRSSKTYCRLLVPIRSNAKCSRAVAQELYLSAHSRPRRSPGQSFFSAELSPPPVVPYLEFCDLLVNVAYEPDPRSDRDLAQGVETRPRHVQNDEGASGADR